MLNKQFFGKIFALMIMMVTLSGCTVHMAKHFWGMSHIEIIFGENPEFHKQCRYTKLEGYGLKQVHEKLKKYWNTGEFSEDGKRYYMIGCIYYWYAKERMAIRKKNLYPEQRKSAEHDLNHVIWRLTQTVKFFKTTLKPCGFKDAQSKTFFTCDGKRVPKQLKPMLAYTKRVIKKLKKYRSWCKPLTKLAKQCKDGTLKPRKVCKNPKEFYRIYCDPTSAR